jgi:hypothetical protein
MFLFLSGSGVRDGCGDLPAGAGAGMRDHPAAPDFPPRQAPFPARPESAVLAMMLLCFAFHGGESLVTLMATRDLRATLTEAGLGQRCAVPLPGDWHAYPQDLRRREPMPERSLSDRRHQGGSTLAMVTWREGTTGHAAAEAGTVTCLTR